MVMSLWPRFLAHPVCSKLFAKRQTMHIEKKTLNAFSRHFVSEM